MSVIEKNKVYQVRIKTRAHIGQDFHFFQWPDCFPPGFEGADKVEEGFAQSTKYPNQIFDGVFNGRQWVCTRIGYGKLRKECPNVPESVDVYGCGSIHVFESDGVEIVVDGNLCPHCGKSIIV